MSVGIISLLVLVVVVIVAIPILARVMGEAARQDTDYSGDFPEDRNDHDDKRENGNRHGDVRDFEKE